MNRKIIGVLGGTFDPIHFGHIRMGIDIYQDLNLDEVKFIPSYTPVHKTTPITTPHHRLEMVKLGIDNIKGLTVDDCEIQRKGGSYTIDTIEYLKQKNPDASLCLIVGIDAFLDFASWDRHKDILKLTNLIIVSRPGYALPTEGYIAELIKNTLQEDHNALRNNTSGCTILCTTTNLDISATKIRHQVAEKLNPRFLLPDSVLKYIKENDIYSSNVI